MANLSKTVCYGPSGYYAEVYDEDTDRIGAWYGSRVECESIDPREVKLYPYCFHESPDAFDLACERRFD